MRIYLFMLAAFLTLTNAAYGGVGDVGVSEGSTDLQPSSSYVAGATQTNGLESQIPSTTFQGRSGFQPLSSSGLAAYQMGVAQGTNLPKTQANNMYGQNYPSALASYPSIPSSQSYAGELTASYPIAQMSASSFGAPELSGPYQEHFSPDELKLSQPQAETFQPDGSLNFISTTSPPSSMLIETPSGATSGAETGAGAWYFPGSVSSRNKFYVQTATGLKTVAACNYGGYVPLWSNIASSDNFFVYEWYPGQTSPYVRWWGWTWPGWKKGWFSGDVPGWHILCYHCRDASNYVYIYVWPSGSSAGSTRSGYNQVGATQMQTPGSLPTGAPTPPDPNAENLMLPNFNLMSQGQYNSQGQAGYTTQTFSTVFPKPSNCRCNAYYVQAWPNNLNTVGAVKCGEWLPLWSNIGRAGYYWSYEWAQGCGYPSGAFCNPEVKNFGYKGTGWYSTWFRGNKQGWHILSYYSNDWSNYIYIYVWPTS
jgi:hypothetical protein